MKDAIIELKKRFRGDVLTAPEACEKFGLDATKLFQMPAVVLLPHDENDVIIAVKIANRYNISITPQGGQSGLTGAATPEPNGWIISLKHWKNIAIDAKNGLAHVQPGAIISDIQTTASAQKLFYPPDPASRNYATIGGTIATNAGGMTGAKYGVTRDYVVSLRVILPTSETVTLGTNTRKNVSGIDLKNLIIGSEGTLGIITHATLRLIPQPEKTWTVQAFFPSADVAFTLPAALRNAGVTPCACEYISPNTAKHVMGKTAPVVLIELDGTPAQVAADAQKVKEILLYMNADFQSTDDKIDRETLWQMRRNCGPTLTKLAPAKLNEDVTFPTKSYPIVAQKLTELAAWYGGEIPYFGHLADGNLHVYVLYDDQNPTETTRAWECVKRLFQLTVDVGGVITGEHGIGLAKSNFLHMQHTPAEINAMKAIKKALDPKLIMNPGKIFTPTDMTTQTYKKDLPFAWEAQKDIRV